MGIRRRTAPLGALVIAVCLVGLVTPASADLIRDPIVRVRGESGSIPITSLPFTYSFTFTLVSGVPVNPDLSNCSTGADASTELLAGDPVEPWVSCNFQNLTGTTISALDFLYTSQAPPYNATALAFFDVAVPGETTAQFSGGTGIPTATYQCFDGDLELICYWVGGFFTIDWIGFANGSSIQMTAVPEPASVGLVLAGLALAGLRFRRGR